MVFFSVASKEISMAAALAKKQGELKSFKLVADMHPMFDPVTLPRRLAVTDNSWLQNAATIA